jgi:thiol-disulfide isomerase/thioredoxin
MTLAPEAVVPDFFLGDTLIKRIGTRGMMKFKTNAPARAGARRAFHAVLVAVLIALATALPAAFAVAEPPLTGVFKDNFTLLAPPVPAPGTTFKDADGRPLTLGAFQGRVVLLNFWATWCAPCIREMPSLDRVQARFEDEGLSVVAVSEDFAGLPVVRPFFERLGLEHLKVYLDVDFALLKALGVQGLPTTLLIDRQGRLVGGMEGPAEWDEDDAAALIRYYLNELPPALDTGFERPGASLAQAEE